VISGQTRTRRLSTKKPAGFHLRVDTLLDSDNSEVYVQLLNNLLTLLAIVLQKEFRLMLLNAAFSEIHSLLSDSTRPACREGLAGELRTGLGSGAT
jgi:hypothetical protein